MLEQRRLQQGLAEIQMLDKQLKAVAKRDSSSRRSALALTLDDAEFGADGDTDGLNSGKPVRSQKRLPYEMTCSVKVGHLLHPQDMEWGKHF